ncbi:SHOCT domain-containing protein [Glycomyces harbinensis]|uniref:Putative membrane protein n=1 Tax=Glycomyces harbinensis TaxID=58114 RepID=A0A1G6XML9_9ACTN|nr:hypothetical protein [Glycomyces harbinensis]SDD79464.1 putative membrane protein [Glycomyces harbinensis]
MMMYGNGSSGWGMVVMSLLWIALIATIIWAAVAVAGRRGAVAVDRRAPETAREILDRRFAQGEIDADAYTRAVDLLARGGPAPQ